MRPLHAIVAAIRSGQEVNPEELRYAVVAFDVLLYQLDLPNDPERLQHYFTAAESDPREYIGEANDPDNPDAVAWYKAMSSIEAPKSAPECTCGQVPHWMECPLHGDTA